MAAAAKVGKAADASEPVLLSGTSHPALTLDESAAKARLAAYGLDTPRARRADLPEDAASVAESLRFPVVVKGQGAAHKTEAGLVALNLVTGEQVAEAAAAMQTSAFLIDEMVQGAIVELLIGVMRDPAHGFGLTIGAGGVQTEILGDCVSMLLPASDVEITSALAKLRIAPLLNGFRGQPGVDLSSIRQAIRSIEAFVLDNRSTVVEVEVNPLICTNDRAIAADALIRMGEDE